MQRRTTLIYLCLWLACAFPSVAQQRQVHDLSLVEGGYRVSGPDPYFIVNFDDPLLSVSDNARRLAVNLSITNPIENAAAPSIELFYLLSADTASLFDPYQRLKLSLPSTPSQGFEVALPTGLTLESGSRLRIDINACGTCTLIPLMRSETLPMTAKLEQAYLGRTELDDKGYRIGSDGWHLNDLRSAGPQKSGPSLPPFQIDGGDPYLVSPALNFGTANLGGILFEFRIDEPDSNIVDFQLFYATEKHRFVEPASSIVRVQGNNGKLEFLVPLEFLNAEFPPAQTLEKIRLDITNHSVVQGQRPRNGTWQLDAAQLLSKAQLKQFVHLVPDTLVNSKLQRQNKRQVLQNIATKLSRDWLFLAAYLLLLLTLSVGLWRKLRDY